MNYREAMQYIEEVQPLGSVMGLETMRHLCAALGDPQDQLKFVHIAGTNGKGSYCLFYLFRNPVFPKFKDELRKRAGL